MCVFVLQCWVRQRGQSMCFCDAVLGKAERSVYVCVCVAVLGEAERSVYVGGQFICVFVLQCWVRQRR